jgi:hypothetical protein
MLNLLVLPPSIESRGDIAGKLNGFNVILCNRIASNGLNGGPQPEGDEMEN